MEQGHFTIHAASVGEDLQLLWHISATLPALAEIIGEDENPMARLTDAYLLSGITERMYAAAFKMRVLDDAIKEESGKSALRLGSCGRLWHGESAARTLTPREACNKIIHMRRLDFKKYPSPPHPLTGIAEISGSWRGVPWLVDLSVAEFAAHCVRAMDEWGFIDSGSRAIMRK